MKQLILLASIVIGALPDFSQSTFNTFLDSIHAIPNNGGDAE
jgi:hypothetical protein